MNGKDWWRGAAVYQIYPRSFQDSNGDGIGDLPGIVSRLSYIAELGVDAIWISPFFSSPMKDFGYDVSDYRAVDPLFGSLEDFDRLVAKAHQLGLKVIIDQVLSHTSDAHPWFLESRASRTGEKTDWYVWAEPRPDGGPPNNWLAVFGGSAWQWEPRRRQYYLHNFLAAQPDLNYHCPAVQKQILEEVRFWLERGVDGCRFDACDYYFHDRRLRDNPPVSAEHSLAAKVRKGNPYTYQLHRYDKTQQENLDFLRALRALLERYGAVGLGEVGEEEAPEVIAQYTGGSDKLHMAYDFSMLMLSRRFSAAEIRRRIENRERQILPTKGWGGWAFSNHDSQRVMTRWGRGRMEPALAKVLLAMLGSLRGSVCLYQGEELGLTEADLPYQSLRDPYGIALWPEYKGRDGCRTPMPWTSASPYVGFSTVEPWLPVPGEHRDCTVDEQAARDDSVLSFTRQFFAWRRHQTALRLGEISLHDAPEPVLLLIRRYADQAVMAALNLGAEPVAVKLPEVSVRAMTGHGLAGAVLDGRCLRLAPFGGFFGALG